MIKLIVSDFDGTLLPYGESRVSDEVKSRIFSALSKNMIFAVSSGRTYGELVSFFPEFADEMYFICCDGAYYVKSGKLFYGRKIEKSDLAPFFVKQGRDFSFILHGADVNYSVGRLPADGERFNASPISHAGEIKEKIYKITSYGSELKLVPYSGLRMHWDGGKNQMAQYVNRFANKGAALSDLQTRLMLTKFETACMGDSGNDVAMMHNAKMSFAVGDRSRELASVVTSKVGSATEALDEIL